MSAVVTTTSGPVAGTSDNGVRRWMGIPYAAAPFGENHLRRPQPHAGWSEPRDASQPGPTVPKGPYREPFHLLLPEPHIDGQECLNLNIWAPDDAEGLPVLFWIHGGAFVNGSGIVPHYDGTTFARDGIIVVTINYRMGIEGFLDTGDENTNLGLRDQIAALEWVRENIAAFGGDPDRVTIAGESAGAISVACLLASPLADGLFARAISQSGSGHIVLSPQTAQKITGEFASRLGIEPTREAFAAIDPAKLLEVSAAVRMEMAANPNPLVWGEAAQHSMANEPVIDADLLPKAPIDLIREGAGKGVDVMIGSNSDEFRFFMVPIGAQDLVTDQALQMAVAGYGYNPQSLDVLRAAADDGSPGDVLAELVTQWYFWLPSIRLAEAHGRNGGNAYLYEFAWQSPVFDGKMRAGHYCEVPFVFNCLGVETDNLLGPNPPQQLADTMHQAWVSFISSGDPGWAAYDEQTRATMVFDEKSSVQDDPRAASRTAWDNATIPR